MFRPLALLVACVLTGFCFTGLAVAAPSTTWTAAGSTPTAIASGATTGSSYRPSAFRLLDGRAFVLDTSTAGFLYDGSAGSWARTTAGAPGGAGQAATLLTDGRVLAVAGSAAALWNPGGDAWSATGAPPADLLPSWVVTLADGRVLAGGETGRSARWSPGDGSWDTTTTAMTYAHGAGAAVARLADGRVLVAGGAGTPSGAEVFDPAAGVWSAVSGLRQRADAVAVPLPSGDVVVVGGTDGGPLSTVDRLPAGTTAFEPATGLVTARRAPLVAPLGGGSLLVAGGVTAGGAATATAEVLDLTAGSAEPAGGMAVARTYGAAVPLSDGRVLAASGTAGLLADLYHPRVTDQATAAAPSGPLSGVVQLSATSAGPDVRFDLDGTPLGIRPVSGGTATIPLDTYGRAPGSHSLVARTCNAAGCGPASDPVALTIDNPAPALTAPAPGQVVRATTTLSATAPGGGVRFLLDGTPIGTDLEPPYTTSFNPFTTTSGPHTLSVRSCDVAGFCEGADSAPVAVTVDLQPSLASPAPDAAVSGDVHLTATAQGPVVRFYVDGVDVSGPVTPAAGEAGAVWSSFGFANGTRQVTARNCDPDLGCAAPSAVRAVTLGNAAPEITFPSGGATVAVPVILAANAPGGRVRFELDGNPVGEPVTSPYQQAFDPANYEGGSHTLVARSCATVGARCDGPASAPVSFTTSPRPDVQAPAGGTSVSGVVPLRATSPAAGVLFLVDGVQVARAATVDGVAAASWETFGLSNGPHDVSAVACDAGWNCAMTPRTVTVTVTNAAPAITGPAPGAVVGDAVTLSAAAPAGSGVRFEVDGVAVGYDATAPYAIRWNTAGFPLGTHLLVARSCDSSLTTCDGPASAGLGFRLAKLNPRIDAVAPRAISPNGDGVQEAVTVTYTIDTTSGAVLRVLDAAGKQVYGRSLGTLAAGRRTFLWNGRNSAGALLPNGVYLLQLDTSRPSSGGYLRGQARVGGIVVDMARPAIGRFAGGGTFYPVPDGHADTFTPYFTLGERAGVVLRIHDAAGRAVFAAGSTFDPGVVRVTWNGRLPSGAIAAAGSYTYQWTVTDPAGNRAVSPRFPFGLSTKRLVARLGTRTVTPYDTFVRGLVGACGQITRDYPGWPGSLVYQSHCYYDGTDADLAITQHRFTLPAAPKYGNVQVKAIGQAYTTQDVAGMFYDYDDSSVTILRPAYGTYALAPVPLSVFGGSRDVRWWAGVLDFNWYVIRSFQVSWVYYELR